MTDRSLRALDLLAWIIPYALAAFLAGLLVMGWRSEIRMDRQWQARIGEANLRQDVLREAITVLAKGKFDAAQAQRDAIRQLNKKGEPQ